MDERAKPKETAKAAQAWADYLALGPGRSLEKLAHNYLNATESVPTRQLSRLKEWSTDHGWQDRLKAIAEEQAAEATDLRRAVYLRVLREYDRRTTEPMIDAAKLDDLHGVYDRVKPEAGRATTVRQEADGSLTVVIGERQDGPQ